MVLGFDGCCSGFYGFALGFGFLLFLLRDLDFGDSTECLVVFRVDCSNFFIRFCLISEFGTYSGQSDLVLVSELLRNDLCLVQRHSPRL